MISDQFALELRPVLTAQRDLLGRLRAQVDAAHVLTGSRGHAVALAELTELMATIEAGTEFLSGSDLADFDPDAIPAMYKQRTSLIDGELRGVLFSDWPSFVRECRVYCATRELDSLLPYETFLDSADIDRLRNESYGEQYRWDRWDYAIVGLSAVLATLTDVLLVRIPKSIVYQGQRQAGSPLTAWLKQYSTDNDAEDFRSDWFGEWARSLEARMKVPYDAQAAVFGESVERMAGMSGRTHRFQSLGHDPVLGFVVGIADILRGSVTGFSYDSLIGKHTWISRQAWCNTEPVGLIEAFLRHLGHLASDVATPDGLPAPFLPIAQAFNIGRFGPKDRSVAQLARYMYVNGYDLRHFLVSGIGPGLIEALLRAFIMVRHYREHGEAKFVLANHPKYRLMLLSAHAAAAVCNAGKVALYHGNPLAINEAQWLAFGRYLLPSMKYWLFDRDRLKLDHVERINDEGWTELTARSASVMEAVARQRFPLISLDLRN